MTVQPPDQESDLGRSGALWRRRTVGRLLLICLLALLLRGWAARQAVSISVDSAGFIHTARRLAEAPLEALREQPQHPLYPAMLLGVQRMMAPWAGGGPEAWILAGRIVAIAGSLAAVIGVYWLTARVYDRRRGLLAATMMAVLPDACLVGADVLSDLPHMAFYLFGLAAIVEATHARRDAKSAAFLVIAAALAALAFLTRPEGGAVLLIGVATALLLPRRPWKRRAALAAGMLAAFLALAGPYQLATGRLIQKKSLAELFGIDTASAELPSRPHAHAKGVGMAPSGRPVVAATAWPVPLEVIRQWFRAGRVVYVLLAIIGLTVAARREPRPPRPGWGFPQLLTPLAPAARWEPHPPGAGGRGRGGRVLAAAAGIHVVLLTALAWSFGYLDLRHALILAALSLTPAAAGAAWLGARLADRRAWPAYAVVGLCVLLTGPWLLRPIQAGQQHVVATARWIAAHTPADALLVGDRRLHRVAIYADRRFVEWQPFLAAPRSACFVVDSNQLADPSRNPPGLATPERFAVRLGGGRIEMIHREPAAPSPRDAKDFSFDVYRYLRE